ncbi:MAG: UDP-N-acetylmuramoyl-tripeptide--D-alanyl-D-alanine ligase [Clostridia bacterium]|nr:UDP-N-acetylmuramoyl-tripeptide--D-alanyl-D-alanine ligase [Clostridia bacterium]
MKELTLKTIAAWCGGEVDAAFENLTVKNVQTDSRKVTAGDLFIALPGEKADGHMFVASAAQKGAVAALVSRDVQADIACIKVPDTIRAFGAIAAGYRKELGIKVIGITGSVGKTTTKEMTACIMERTFRTAKTEGNHNNQLGLPMSILAMPEDTQLAVLEMGMNHFGEMTYLSSIAKPDVAIITNIGTMHIEHLGTRQGILEAKLEILKGMPDTGIGVFNGDEPLLWNVRNDGGHKKYYYGIENRTCDVVAGDIQELEDGMRFVVTGFGHQFELFVPVVGRHAVYDALAAVTAALLLGVKPEIIQIQFSGFRNTGMRQRIYDHNGMTIIEDCYNAGPESMEAALHVLGNYKTGGKRIAVLGDMLELGNRSSAEHYRIGRLAVANTDMLFTYGAHSVRTVTGAITGGMSLKNTEHFDSHEALAHVLKMRAAEGDVLLFKGSRGMKMEKVLEMFLTEDNETL